MKEHEAESRINSIDLRIDKIVFFKVKINK